MLGGSVLADAARFGSYAHRVYQSWSNLSAPEHVSSVVENAARPTGRRLVKILTLDHAVPIMGKQMRAPYYPVTMAACQLWPSIQARWVARVFRRSRASARPCSTATRESMRPHQSSSVSVHWDWRRTVQRSLACLRMSGGPC
ncbi:hypothetical protein Vretifemale_5051 [Volvox reticuliferus]|uniref:Uncharacterized protein n=1 Tax=Volvox reticuliferus TaxID=1737510 RepID=A0A8J4CB44_9CHLO|nr:hypothetical protein Vretifemale_5051 [Volvox reticuliferus]